MIFHQEDSRLTMNRIFQTDCKQIQTDKNLINFNRLQYTSGKLKLIVFYIMKN